MKKFFVPTPENLEKKFDAFRARFFGNTLRRPRFSTDCGELFGELRWDFDASGKRCIENSIVLCVSDKYKLTEREVDEVLLHEMIHLEFVLAGDFEEHHGPRFLRRSADIRECSNGLYNIVPVMRGNFEKHRTTTDPGENRARSECFAAFLFDDPQIFAPFEPWRRLYCVCTRIPSGEEPEEYCRNYYKTVLEKPARARELFPEYCAILRELPGFVQSTGSFYRVPDKENLQLLRNLTETSLYNL